MCFHTLSTKPIIHSAATVSLMDAAQMMTLETGVVLSPATPLLIHNFF